MIAFEIHLNGEKLCVAGIGERGVLSQHLSWVGRELKAKDVELKTIEPYLHIGGLVNDQHVSWIKQRTLDVGDEVVIKIVEVEVADEPTNREPRESDEERARKVRDGLDATKALLPSPLVEGEFLASLREYEQLLAAYEPEMSVKVLANLGDLNNCAPEFWESLEFVASELQMYQPLDSYRAKAKRIEELEADASSTSL